MSNPNVICNNLGPYPTKAWATSGGLVNVNQAVICGGWIASGGSSPPTDKCYDAVTGLEVAALLDERQYSASIVFNETTLLITGGSDEPMGGGPYFDSTEFVTPGRMSEYGPSLPLHTKGHCLVRVNESTIVMIGGELSETQTFFYTFDGSESDNGWTVGPTLLTSHAFHSCAVMTKSPKHSGPVVVISGGWDVNNRTEFLDLGTASPEWIQGNII